MVPRAVWDELRAFHTLLPDSVSLRPSATAEPRLPETQSLGRGEAVAIQLAREIQANLLLLDDLKARAVAPGMKNKMRGAAGGDGPGQTSRADRFRARGHRNTRNAGRVVFVRCAHKSPVHCAAHHCKFCRLELLSGVFGRLRSSFAAPPVTNPGQSPETNSSASNCWNRSYTALRWLA
jgi:hypothetical protein